MLLLQGNLVEAGNPIDYASFILPQCMPLYDLGGQPASPPYPQLSPRTPVQLFQSKERGIMPD